MIPRPRNLPSISYHVRKHPSYVRLAARLGEDVKFRAEVVGMIDERQWAIWERREEVRRRFFTPSWACYLSCTLRNATLCSRHYFLVEGLNEHEVANKTRGHGTARLGQQPTPWNGHFGPPYCSPFPVFFFMPAGLF